MRLLHRILSLRLLVALFAAGLFLVWFALNAGRMAAIQDGLIRFTLTAFFSLLILLRPGKPAAAPHAARQSPLLAAGLIGCLLAISGIVLPLHQFEWVGILLMLAAALRWALPPRFARDIPLALFLLYWAHPLPNPFFGWIQLRMQALSVAGSEWLLHLLNTRIWADGMILRTAGQVFEIPAWCSGMRSATTMFILAWGLGILQRLRPLPAICVAFLAVIQALGLNILRISLMVFITPGHVESNSDFLHDSAGIILVAGVVLVYLEVRFARRRLAATPDSAMNSDPPPDTPPLDPLSLYPPFWRNLRSKPARLAAALAVILALTAALAWKNRPYHRGEMIKGTAAGLRDAGRLDDAQRAAQAAIRLVPGDREWRMEIVRLLILRGRYADALDELDNLAAGDPALTVQQGILRAYSLMGLDRRDEAAAAVSRLPAGAGLDDPRLAMVLAEIGQYTESPDTVAAHVLRAARWRPNQGRIRRLFPYLRNSRKWNVIVAADSRAPFTDAAQALSAAEACMNLNRVIEVSNIAGQAMRQWPQDPRLLEVLFFLAMKHPGSPWEDRYGEHLQRCAAVATDPDALYSLMEKCFQLTRPDLAWALCRRIHELDPAHPSLPMAATRFGNIWFTFRKNYLGLSAPAAADTHDLRQPFLALRGFQPPLFRWWTDRIPFAKELLGGRIPEVRQSILEKALIEFRKRDEAGALSIPMQYEYASALEMARDFAAARRQLDRLAGSAPDQVLQARIAQSEIFERVGDWQGVYESLRDFPFDSQPRLLPLIRLCRAQWRLRLGLIALHTAREAVRLFPSSSLATATWADVLQEMGSPEDALFILSQPRPRKERNLDTLEATLLDRTERPVEARRFRRSALLPSQPPPPGQIQRHLLPPAEWALLWHRTALPPERDYDAHAQALRQNLPTTSSPFFSRLTPLWLDRHSATRPPASPGPASSGPAGAALPPVIETWQACGRDRFEQATALNQLTLLLCREERWADARLAAGKAVQLFPESAHLHRILIGLSGADPAVIQAARNRCPDDGDIWLAALVAGVEPPSPVHAPAPAWDDAAATRHISAALGGAIPRYAPGVMTRAGDYLLRRGLRQAAALAARDAVSRARGLLPSYVLGVQSAMASGDKARALDCTRLAIDASLQPATDFYLKVVELKTAQNQIGADQDLVAALEHLRRIQPGEPLWAQMLGYVRFQRGDWEIVDSAYAMLDAIDKGATNRTPFLIGAEASRLFGNHERAVELLRKGLAIHTHDVALLNNLVYTLATGSTNATEALAYLPRLLELDPDSLPVLDTAVVAYIRAGQHASAVPLLARLLEKAAPGTPPWFRARLHEARIMVAQAGSMPVDSDPARRRQKEVIREARRHIMTALQGAQNLPEADIRAANRLISDLDIQLQPPRPAPARIPDPS